MSRELFEVLSLASRYLFALLGVLISVRVFFWLLRDRSDRAFRRSRIPAAGLIGELIVLSGNSELKAGLSIPVPWEGVLGSVRSCDIYIPAPQVHRKHLSFSYERGKGLLIHPFSGCEAFVNAARLDTRSQAEAFPVTHGSILQVGDVLLRLCVFVVLDPNAFPDQAASRAVPYGVDEGPDHFSETPAAYPVPWPAQTVISRERELPFRPFAGDGSREQVFIEERIPSGDPAAGFPPSPGSPFSPDQPVASSAPAEMQGPESINPVSGRNIFGSDDEPKSPDGQSPAPRRRRRSGWEADWSE